MGTAWDASQAVYVQVILFLHVGADQLGISTCSVNSVCCLNCSPCPISGYTDTWAHTYTARLTCRSICPDAEQPQSSFNFVVASAHKRSSWGAAGQQHLQYVQCSMPHLHFMFKFRVHRHMGQPHGLVHALHALHAMSLVQSNFGFMFVCACKRSSWAAVFVYMYSAWLSYLLPMTHVSGLCEYGTRCKSSNVYISPKIVAQASNSGFSYCFASRNNGKKRAEARREKSVSGCFCRGRLF